MNCSFSECDRKSRSGKLCAAHYWQQWSGKELTSLRPKIGNGKATLVNRKEQSRIWNRKYNYNLTENKFLTMLVLQDSKCGICQKDFPSKEEQKGRGRAAAVSIDHDHETEIVRGILCFHCNTGLGHFRDNKEILTKAIAYLER